MTRKLRSTRTIVAATLAATLAVGLVSVGSASAAHRVDSIDISNFKYHPYKLEVQPGDRVKVFNFDGSRFGIPHSITAYNGAFDTGVFADFRDAFYAPRGPGNYDYFCKVHPDMRGVLRVIR